MGQPRNGNRKLPAWEPSANFDFPGTLSWMRTLGKSSPTRSEIRDCYHLALRELHTKTDGQQTFPLGLILAKGLLTGSRSRFRAEATGDRSDCLPQPLGVFDQCKPQETFPFVSEATAGTNRNSCFIE